MTVRRAFYLAKIASLVALTPSASGTHIVGNLDVDGKTLPRLASVADVLVRVSVADTLMDSYEEDEHHFRDLAKRFVGSSDNIRDDFLIATVVVQFETNDIDYETGTDPDNNDVAAALGASGDFEVYPEYFFLEKGTKELSKAKKYAGSEKTADAIATFVFAEAGVLLGGETLKEMDDIARQFITSEEYSDRKKDLVAAAEKVADSFSGTDDKEIAGIYVKVMVKATEKGTPYFSTETARVSKLLTEGRMSRTQRAKFLNKLKVLGSFTNPVGGDF